MAATTHFSESPNAAIAASLRAGIGPSSIEMQYVALCPGLSAVEFKSVPSGSNCRVGSKANA